MPPLKEPHQEESDQKVRYKPVVEVDWLAYPYLSPTFPYIPTYTSDSDESEWSGDYCGDHYWWMRSGFLPQSAYKLLHWYNRCHKKSPNEHVPMHVLLRTRFQPVVDLNDPETQQVIGRIRESMESLQKQWEERETCKFLKDTITQFKDGFIPIRRIICLGFGPFRESPRQEPLHQHLAAVTIASSIDALNASLYPDSPPPPVEIIAQDPAYGPVEKLLFPELGRKITFVDDPDGILAVDKHTLIIAPYSPIFFPFMQILSDLFWNTPPDERPAGFMFDNADTYRTLEQKTHGVSGRARLTPRAAKFLASNYTHLDYQTWHIVWMFRYAETDESRAIQLNDSVMHFDMALDQGHLLGPAEQWEGASSPVVWNPDYWFWQSHIFLRGEIGEKTET
ncbi:hypothetical protein BDV96DRAFT_269948 [Lophiotrema nucula]|uniref:SRR1-like domain-containing protein n=1 Tax=Lophiotrema nucula TaxID=690887 RepID=A0A6A5ZNW2_9PLEO|nr:hypothetical protein BDV96DRAFT_269948 [Lophiotrema nucula]